MREYEWRWPSFDTKILRKIIIAECQCENSLDGNVCDVTTGQCGLCKPGFFGDFCDKGKQKCL